VSGDSTKGESWIYRFSAKDNDGIKTITYKVYQEKLDSNGEKYDSKEADETIEVNGNTEYNFAVSIKTHCVISTNTYEMSYEPNLYKVQIKVTDSKGNVESITYTEF
jgi:hypothetical protein